MNNNTKQATLKIQLVPESQTINNEQIKKEIRKSLTCDWLLKIQNIEIDSPSFIQLKAGE